MKIKKKKLEALKVQSFILNDQKQNVQGGGGGLASAHNLCLPAPSRSANHQYCCCEAGY